MIAQNLNWADEILSFFHGVALLLLCSPVSSNSSSMEGAAIPNHGDHTVDARTGISAESHVAVDGDAPSVSAPSDDFTGYPEKAYSESPSSSTSSRDALARGISSLLGSILKDFDLRAHHALCSQDNLSSSIDRLTQELDRLLKDAPLPFIMQHAARISSVRRRVASMNTILKSVQRRVDNIDRILSIGSQAHPGIEKTPTEGS